jgi:DNA-binding transcriptional LysR family regulator
MTAWRSCAASLRGSFGWVAPYSWRNLRTRLQAAIHGIGIALLPEQVISAPLKEGLVERVSPDWGGAKNILHLVYPTPRGMLPSVRSLIDYLLIHVPARLREHSIQRHPLGAQTGNNSTVLFNSHPSARPRACRFS